MSTNNQPAGAEPANRIPCDETCRHRCPECHMGLTAPRHQPKEWSDFTMPVATGQKSVTKTALIAFVRENSTLNLTQSKALADHLLTEYNVTARPPADLDSMAVEVGQLWQYTGTPLVVRITDVELAPQYVPNDPITIWSPESISWQNTADSASQGVTHISTWLKCMRRVEAATRLAAAQDETTESSDPA